MVLKVQSSLWQHLKYIYQSYIKGIWGLQDNVAKAGTNVNTDYNKPDELNVRSFRLSFKKQSSYWFIWASKNNWVAEYLFDTHLKQNNVEK